MIAPTRPVMRYHGGKWRIANWIIRHFPEHRIYVEPFGGAGSVLMRKPRSYAEVYNDLDRDVYNVFMVLRDPAAAEQLTRAVYLTPYSRDEFWGSYEPAEDPIERARRTVLRAAMAFGSSSRRANRTGFRGKAYRQSGMVVLSGYPCPLYDDGWREGTHRSPLAQPRGRRRPAADTLHAHERFPHMRFTNIRFANKEVKLDWEEKTDQEIDTHDKKSAEPPTDAFKAALDGMRKHLPLCSDLPESYVAPAEMLSVGISYNAQNARSVTLQAKRKVTNSNTPISINTPSIKETEEIRDGSLFDAELGAFKALFNDVDELCKHAGRFLEGDRGEPEGDTEERETDPGQTTIEEHIDEAAKGEARKAFLAIMGEKPANIGSSNRLLTNAIVSRFDAVEYEDSVDRRKVPGLFRHELRDDDGAVVRYVWCHVDTTADIPKLFYDAPAENFNVASATATLVGFQMVAILREVWELPAPARNGKKPQAGNVTADDTALAGAGV